MPAVPPLPSPQDSWIRAAFPPVRAFRGEGLGFRVEGLGLSHSGFVFGGCAFWVQD